MCECGVNNTLDSLLIARAQPKLFGVVLAALLNFMCSVIVQLDIGKMRSLKDGVLVTLMILSSVCCIFNGVLLMTHLVLEARVAYTFSMT